MLRSTVSAVPRRAHRAGAVALLAFAGCSDPTASSEPAFLEGRITRLADESRGYLVEGTPGPGHRVDRAYFRVTGRTTLLHRAGGRARVSDLVVGRTVSLWITGVSLDSDPPQVTARALVLEAEAAGKP
jgi:hypothetical protein